MLIEMEEYNKIKKILALGFIHFLDENRPEGKMCLSNGECAEIEKAFNEQDWQKLTKCLDKYIETEDERHRKWVLEYLYDGLRKADEQFKDHFKAAIDWLEKQKESLHIPETCKENADSFTDNVIEVRSFQRGIEEGRRLEREKQKEQKPAEWSEEDAKRIKQLIYDTEAIRAGYEKKKEVLGERFNNELIKDCDKQIAWLKSLRPQPKKEWSEEDENKIESIKGLITTGRFVDTNTIRTIWKLLDSLRPKPHWKPSEEQMDSLRDTIVQTKGYSYSTYLPELYEQLKKRM